MPVEGVTVLVVRGSLLLFGRRGGAGAGAGAGEEEEEEEG